MLVGLVGAVLLLVLITRYPLGELVEAVKETGMNNED